MKVTIDMTPEEARKLMGLPDLEPLQEEMLEKMREQMQQNLEDIRDPEFFFKKVFPAGVQSAEGFQKVFADFMAASSPGHKKND